MPFSWDLDTRPFADANGAQPARFSLRQTDDAKIFFLLNHQNTPVRVQFYKPMHDFLTGSTFTGNFELSSHGVLVLDEHPEVHHPPPAETAAEASAEPTATA